MRPVDGAPIGGGDSLRLRGRLRSDPPGTRIQLELEAEDGARREATLALAERV